MSALYGEAAEDDYGAFSGEDGLVASDHNGTADLNISTASTEVNNMAGIVATSVALGLLTLTTIIGKAY